MQVAGDKSDHKMLATMLTARVWEGYASLVCVLACFYVCAIVHTVCMRACALVCVSAWVLCGRVWVRACVRFVGVCVCGVCVLSRPCLMMCVHMCMMNFLTTYWLVILTL